MLVKTFMIFPNKEGNLNAKIISGRTYKEQHLKEVQIRVNRLKSSKKAHYKNGGI